MNQLVHTRVPSILKPPPSSLPTLSLPPTMSRSTSFGCPSCLVQEYKPTLSPTSTNIQVPSCLLCRLYTDMCLFDLCSSLVLSNLVFNWIFHSHLDLLFSSLSVFSKPSLLPPVWGLTHVSLRTCFLAYRQCKYR